MKVYRLKDPKTGLYYCPSRDIKAILPDGRERYVKSNLSKKGKIYYKSYNNDIRHIHDHTEFKRLYDCYSPIIREVQFEVEYLN